MTKMIHKKQVTIKLQVCLNVWTTNEFLCEGRTINRRTKMIYKTQIKIKFKYVRVFDASQVDSDI